MTKLKWAVSASILILFFVLSAWQVHGFAGGTLEVVLVSDGTEGGAPVLFDVRLHDGSPTKTPVPALNDLMVRVATQFISGNASAIANEDYVPIDHDVTIPQGQSSVQVPVDVIDDTNLIEGRQLFGLKIISVSDPTITFSASSTLGRINDNEPQIQVEALGPPFFDELAGSAIITLLLHVPDGFIMQPAATFDLQVSGGTTDPATVPSTTGSVPADSPIDVGFTDPAIPGNVLGRASAAFPGNATGDLSWVFSVAIVNDMLDEADENVRITNPGSSPAFLFSSFTVLTVPIRDNDGPGEPNLVPTISNIPNRTVAVNTAATASFSIGDLDGTVDDLSLTVNSSNLSLVPLENIVLDGSGANRSIAVTPVPETTGSATITVTVTDPGGKSASDTLVVTVLPLIFISDAEAVEGSDLVFVVSLSHTTTSPVSFGFATANGTATGGSVGTGADYQSMSSSGAIAAGQTQTTISIPSFDDPVPEGIEVFFVNLSASAFPGDVQGMGSILDNDPLGNPPVAVDDNYSTFEDVALDVPAPGVLANDTDADGGALSSVLVSGPSNGTLQLQANGAFTYTPNAGFSGADSFTYKASDGTADSNTATVTISVLALTVTIIDSSMNPSIFGSPVIFTATVTSGGNPVTEGTVTFSDGGIDLDTAPLDAVGQAALSTSTLSVGIHNINATYNGSPGAFALSIISLNQVVEPANTPPTADAGGPYDVAEGATIQLDASGSSDPDQDVTTLIFEWDLNYNGTTFVVGATGVTAAFDASALDGPTSRMVAVRVTDSSEATAIATASVTIFNVPPAITSSPPDTAKVGDLLVYQPGAIDPAGTADPFVWNLMAGPSGMSIDPVSGLILWVPNASQAGSRAVSLRVSDGDGGEATQSFTLEVAASSNVAVNDPMLDQTQQDTQSTSSTLVIPADGGGLPLVIVAFNDSGSAAGGANRFTGFSRSIDGGNIFTDLGALIGDPLGDGGNPTLARHNDSGAIYLAVQRSSDFGVGIYRSNDNGLTWTLVGNGTPGGFGTQVFPRIAVNNVPGPGNGDIYVAAGHPAGVSVYRSVDDGATFTPSGGVSVATEPANPRVSGIAVDPSDPNVIYLSAAGGGVWKTTDRGQTWIPLLDEGRLGADLGLTRSATDGAAFRTDPALQIAVNPISGNLYQVWANPVGSDKADVFISKSSDGSQTWSGPVRLNDDTTLTDQWQPSIAVTPDGTRLLVSWYDRRRDPLNNHEIDYFGAIGRVWGDTVEFGPNFRITDASFPPVFGVDPSVDPAYMGHYDQAGADNNFLYTTWSDNRNLSIDNPLRNQADIRLARIPLAPRVVSSSPSADEVVDTPPTTIVIRLSNLYDPATVQSTDLLLNGIPADTVQLTDTATLTFSYPVSPVIAEGLQNLHIPAAAMNDLDGRPLDEFLGNFFYDEPTLCPFPTPLSAKPPLGSLIYDSIAANAINFPDDKDECIVDLDLGQTISVLVTPGGPLRPELELRDPLDNLIAATTASAAGKSALINTVSVAGGGTYKISVRGAESTTGSYTVQVVLNAALEEEPLSFGPNNSLATAQNVLGSFLDLANGASRGAVLGRIEPIDSDFYSFTSPAGESMALALRALTGGSMELELQDAAGLVVATGAMGAGNLDQVLHFVPPAAGTYFARVSGAVLSDYSLVVTRHAAFDTEPNDTFNSAQNLSGMRGALGAITGDGADEDWFMVQVTAGQVLTLETRTPGDGPGEFVNNLDPRLELYDASGSLVASGIPGADLRNESIDYSVLTSGAHRVRLLGESATTGEFFLTVTVADSGVPTVNAGEDQGVDEGQLVTVAATFSDTQANNTHSAMINWGDGAVEPAAVTQTDGLSGIVSGSHIFADNGTFIVSVTVADDDGATATDTLTMTVNNVAPVVNAVPDQTVIKGSGVSFSGSFTDPGSADTHTIHWDFGDGATSAGSLNTSHVYANSGTYLVTLTVTDDDGAAGSDTLIVEVVEQRIVATPSVFLVPEGEGAAFNVRLAYRPSDTTLVTLTSSDTTRVTFTPATLTFTPSDFDQPQIVTVTAHHDEDALDNVERITLSAPGIQDTIVTVSVQDEDSPFPTPPVLSIDDVSMLEGSGGETKLIFTVRLSHATSEEVQVQFATVEGTARVSDGDFVDASGTLIFPPTILDQKIEVTVGPDFDPEPDEFFGVQLSKPVHATLAEVDHGIGTILDDDMAGTVFEKELTRGDADGDGHLDLVLPLDVKERPFYEFTITYRKNPGASPVLIEDIVPAEWRVISAIEQPSGRTIFADKGKGGDKDHSIQWFPDPSVLESKLMVLLERKKKTKKDKSPSAEDCVCEPINAGAKAYKADAFGDRLSHVPNLETGSLGIARVLDLNRDGIIDRQGDGDEDSDGLPDYDEACLIGTSPCDRDSDDDGISDGEEVAIGTDPTHQDTDRDGLTDSEELNEYRTDPNNPDSDGDGFNDGDEVALQKNPLDPNDHP